MERRGHSPARRVVRLGGERGQTSLMLIPAVAALLFVALLVTIMLGDGVGKRTNTRTAADAASLAAAEEWRNGVDQLFQQLLGHPGDAVGLVNQLLSLDVEGFQQAEARQAADRLASANGAEVVAFSVRHTSRGLEYHVRTRSTGTVKNTDTKPEGDAVALVDFRNGLCFRSAGIGLYVNGRCLGELPLPPAVTSTTTVPAASPTTTEPKKPPPSHTTTPSPTTSVIVSQPPPTFPPDGMGDLRWRVRLVE